MTANRQSGLSLVEVLVVLAIVGIMASVTLLSVGAAGRSASPEAEADRLASRLRLAMDEALVTDQPIGLVWDQSGYLFQAQSPEKGDWTPYALDILGARHDLPSTLTLEADPKTPFVPVFPDGDGPAVTFFLSDSSSKWQVTLNGFSAIVASAKAS